MHDRALTIRDARPEDGPELSAMQLALAIDGRGMVLAPEQILDAAAERARLEQGGVDLYELVAIREGRVAGSGSLRVVRPAYCRHVGVLGLGVHPAHQRRGVGRTLMEALAEKAKLLSVIRLELSVRADNDRARALYRAVGFEDEGVRRRFVRLDDGTFVDDVIMVRWL